ncbi:hypothetical protein ACOSP7_005270 [Xanthoceras sorbifolium]
MGFLNISAKFDGIQSHFLVDKLEEYTLSSLIADVYLFTLSKLPESYEKFKVEVKLPWSGEYKDHNNSKAAAKKRKSEVGNTSASNARRKLNIGQSPHGQTSIVIAASTSGTGHHPEQSSQPLSQNAPLLSGSQAAYDTHNTSNPSTVAGLNSDWSPTF